MLVSFGVGCKQQEELVPAGGAAGAVSPPGQAGLGPHGGFAPGFASKLGTAGSLLGHSLGHSLRDPQSHKID